MGLTRARLVSRPSRQSQQGLRGAGSRKLRRVYCDRIGSCRAALLALSLQTSRFETNGGTGRRLDTDRYLFGDPGRIGLRRAGATEEWCNPHAPAITI